MLHVQGTTGMARESFGPEPSPSNWKPDDIGAAAAAGGLDLHTKTAEGRLSGEPVYGWGVQSATKPSAPVSTAPDAHEQRRQQRQQRQRPADTAGSGFGGRPKNVVPPSMVTGAAIPADDPVVVKSLTSQQVESSSITTRNGAIQREMQDAYRKLICANVERKLTLQDVASFSTFLVGVRVRLHEKGSNLRRRHSVLSSLLKHAPRARVQRIYSDLAAVEEQESALTKDVDLFNKLQQDLKESPAYKAMMEYGQSSGMVNVDGTMMPDPTKHPELEAMASMSVKDMLAEFKMEDKRNEEQGGGGRGAGSVGGDNGFSPVFSAAAGTGGRLRSGAGAGGLGKAGDAAAPQKNKKGKKGKKDRRR
ncbi:unnamed protein product [Ectocarpus sp. 13 AM-2016]